MWSKNIWSVSIHFNNDYIPDLVATKQSYWVSLYLFDDSKTYDFGIHNPIDQWGIQDMIATEIINELENIKEEIR